MHTEMINRGGLIVAKIVRILEASGGVCFGYEGSFGSCAFMSEGHRSVDVLGASMMLQNTAHFKNR